MSRPFDEEQGPDGPAGAELPEFPDSGLSRRSLLRTAGAASMILPGLAGPAGAAPDAPPGKGAGPAGRFFSAAQLALVDELGETIIPTDDHSPGARAAGVAREIDRRLAELPAFDPQTAPRRRLWREGLRLVEADARKRHGTSFVASSEAQRVAVLTELARNERAPRTPGELFFAELKREVAWAYYTTEIGLKQELEYKGNVSLEEYVGHDPAVVPLGKGPPPGKKGT